MKKNDDDLQARVTQLEQQVAELSSQLERTVKLIKGLQQTARNLDDRTWMLQRIG